MEIAYNQILLLLLQCLVIALLLASLFRLRSILGLGLLYITLGVFQFLQVFLSSSLLVEVASGIFISSGSMVLFTASLFMVLLVYISEGALETRKIIYALLAANLVTFMLLVVLGWSVDNDIVTNVYNLPKEFFSHNARILLVGTVIVLLDAILIIFLYEFISKYVKLLFLRILFTMTLVLSLDSLLFSFGVFWNSDELLVIFIAGLVSKTLAALVYSSFFPLYLVLFDQKSIKSESKVTSFKDIFNTLTFRQKYEDVFTEMKNKTFELQEAQKIAKLGSYILDLEKGVWKSSLVLEELLGINGDYKKDFSGWIQLIHPNDQEMIEEYFNVNVLTNHEKFENEYRIVSYNEKQERWVHDTGQLEFNDAGEPIKLIGTLQDITERKTVELKLLKSENKFRELYEKSADAILILKNGIIIESNQAAVNLFGYKTNENILKKDPSKISPIFQPDGQKSTKKSIDVMNEAVKKGSHKFEWTHINKNGEEFPVEVLLTSISNDPNNKILHVVIRDISDRKETEDSLRKSTQLLEASQYIARVGGWELDIATNNLFWTAETYRIHDTSPEEFNPTVDAGVSYFLPESRRIISEALKVALEQGEGYDLELETLTTKGRLINVRTTCVVSFHEGRPAKLKGIFQDITDKKQAEISLQASEDRFHLFANASFEGIGIHVDGIIQDVNNHLSELSGYSREELIGNSYMMIVHPDDLKKVAGYIKKGYEESLEFRLLNKDGNTVYVEGRGADISYNGKNARISNFYDISDRMKIRKRLIKSEEKFSKAYFNNPIPIFISSIPDGEFIDINPKFEQVSGRSRKELIGKNVTDLRFYANEQDRLKLFKELENKGRLQGYDIEFKVKSGEIRDCKMYSEIIDIDGRPCLISIVSDITEQNRSELELEKQNIELISLSTELTKKHNLLIESEKKFKNLFDKSPVSLWKEDFSKVKQLIDEKKTQTNDLKKYLDENPDFVFECVSKVKILNVNNITLDLFGVNNTKELTNHLSKTFNDKSIEIFKEELLAIASNKKEFSGETEFIKNDGEIITALINFLIIDDNYEKAIVSIVDITELNNAKGKIIESQIKFKKLFDKNPVSLWEVDFYEVKIILDEKKTQTRNLKKYLDDNIDFVMECISKIEILDINKASLDLLGASTKIELINNFGKKFNNKTLEVFKKHLVSIASNEREFTEETEFVKSSGEIITTYLKYVRINDSSDKGIISIIDITELNNAKEKIAESEKQFRELYEKSGDAILIIENGVFIECNRATVDMLGYKNKAAFLNLHPSKLSPILQPDGKKSFDKAIEMMDESLKRGTHRFEWIHTKHNGVEFPVEVLLTAITNKPDNQIIHCVWRDISDRKEIKALLEKSEEKFSKAFTHNPTPLHITSIPDGIFIDINPMFENISGYTRKEVIGKTALELNFYIDLEDRLKYFELLKSKGNVHNHEIQFRAKNGTIRDCNIFSEIIEVDKKPCLLSIVRDVTEQRKAEEALRSLATKFSFLSGSKFIDNVCRYVSETLNVEIAFVGELEPGDNRVIVNYGISSGKPLESFEYDLTGTPCEKVIGIEACSFPKGVQELFPTDHFLVEMNIEGYIGVPLFNSSGNALGILVILDNNIIDNPSFATTMLQIFSERVAAEIERTRAEDALKLSLDKNNILLNATSDLVILVDNEGRIKAVNESMAKSLRSTPDKLLNKVVWDFLPPTIAKSRKEIGIKAAKTGKVVQFIDQNRGLWFANSAYPIFDENQQLMQMAIFSQDITSRKQAEQSLIESENELRQSQEIAQLGTFNFNISTQVFVSSPIFDAIVGFKAKDKKTLETYKEMTHPDDFVKNEKMLKECIITSKKFDREYRIFNYSTKELLWLHGFGEIIYSEWNQMHFKGTIQDITERKLIEIKVKLNERKLKEVQKIANLGTYEIDLKTNDIITSELYISIFGTKKKPTNNKGWWKSITHPEDFEQSELLWQQCIKDCKPYNDEYRILTENNEIRWIHDIAEVKGENGMATKVVGTVQDITERKKTEEKIKRSDDILNQINSLVVVNNSKGDIVYISPSVKNILGYEPSVMLGRGWWRLTYADDNLGEKRIKEIFKHFSGENSITEEVSIRKIKTKEGNYKFIEWHISKASDDTFISVGIDVTERQEQEEQFKTLTETAHDAIILVDHKGLIFEWNKSSNETFGYSKQEIQGKPITSLMPEKYRNQYEKGFSEVMQKGLKESYRNNIVEGLTKEGVVFPMELSVNFWESNNNYVYCYFIRDITQRERDEKIKELIFNITNKSNEALNLNKFFRYIKSELGKLIITDNFFIALYDEKTEMIRTPYMVDELDKASDFPKGETLTGHVIDTKSALLTTGIIFDPESEDQKPIGLGPESKCWLGVPMLVEDKVIGAIVVQSYTDENAYTKDDVEFLELVASNIGQAVKKTEDLVQIRLLNKALIQSPQAVIITNIKGDIEYINPAFTGLSGYSEEDVIGNNPRILKSGKHPLEYYKNLWQNLSKGKTWEGEFVNRHKDGSSYLVEANISSVKNENGKITHYIGVQEDITEKRKLERQFINTFIDAQEVEKQNFGEELHDSISQILSAEGMYINLLIEQNQDRINDKAKFLTKIKELNTNAVNETRNIAHGLMSSQLKQSGLLIAVENICIDFNNSKNIMFSFLNIDVKEEDLTKEIKTNLFRVIQELTTNITRYSSATNASVEFSKVDKDKLRLIVEDNGIGMDYDKIKNERKVTGLKNVERRIIFLNGTLDVNSRPNKGTRWKIIIPLQNIQ